MEDDLNKKWKTNQSTKINLIGCDTIVNSPSDNYFDKMFCNQMCLINQRLFRGSALHLY